MQWSTVNIYQLFAEYHNIVIQFDNVRVYVIYLRNSFIYAMLFRLIINVECDVSRWNKLWSTLVSASIQRTIYRSNDYATSTKTIRSERIGHIRLLIGSLFEGDIHTISVAWDKSNLNVLITFSIFSRWSVVLFHIIWFFDNYVAMHDSTEIHSALPSGNTSFLEYEFPLIRCFLLFRSPLTSTNLNVAIWQRWMDSGWSQNEKKYPIQYSFLSNFNSSLRLPENSTNPPINHTITRPIAWIQY